MSAELVKALFTIVKYCMSHNNCKTCALKDFCGTPTSAWGDR